MIPLRQIKPECLKLVVIPAHTQQHPAVDFDYNFRLGTASPRSSCVYIEYSWSPKVEQLESQIVDAVARDFADCDTVALIVNDVPTWCDQDRYFLDSDLTIDQYPEFLLYNRLKTAFPAKTIEFYHSQHFDLEAYPTKWADVFLLRWLSNDEMHIPEHKLDAGGHKILHNLSCITNRGQAARSYFTVLAEKLNCLLTYRNHLFADLDKHPPVQFSPRIKQIFNDNLKVSCELFDNNCVRLDSVEFSLESFDLINQGFCNVVIDDPVFSNNLRLTEKTFKPMMALRPFLLLSTPGAIEWLHSYGFKTFSQWWDESYDQETDHWRRIEKVYEQAEWISSLSRRQYLNILDQMQPILQHNRENLQKFQKFTVSNLQ